MLKNGKNAKVEKLHALYTEKLVMYMLKNGIDKLAF